MKQARWWLFLAAFLVAVPGSALAQGKKGKKGKGKEPATATTPAPAAGGAIDLDAPATGTAPAPAAGGTIDLDAPEPTKPTEPTTPVAPTAEPSSICDLDPNACVKVELGDKNRVIKQDVYAVQQIYALRRNRLELNPYWSFSLNDQFVAHPGPGLAANFYVSHNVAIGMNFNYYGAFNSDSEFNFQNRRATRLGVPLTEYLMGANINATFVPIYGKFSGFSSFIFNYDVYVVGGIGGLWNRPIPVIDPDNRKFDHKMSLSGNVGAGLRIFFNRWFAVNLELRDYIFSERLENTKIATTSSVQKYAVNPERDPAQWYGTSSLANNVQAQVGISMFLPTSFNYRLQK